MPKEPTLFKRTHFELIGSTQDYLIENASFLLKETDQVVITANEQTKGRGTSNRMWASPPHVNIYATFGIKIPNDFGVYFDLARSPAVMEITALAVVKTLEELGFKPVIKWRNDILINGKKVCGILCEATTSTQGGVGLIGIGINVNMSKEICDGLDQPVTSLSVEAGHEFDKEEIFNILAKNVNHYINIYLKQEFKKCVPEINERLAFIGKRIHVEDQLTKQILEGICLGVDSEGQLRVKIHEHEIRSIRWGRIIKDELTYPEAFSNKNTEHKQVSVNKSQSTWVYSISALLGSAFLLYWCYNGDKQEHSSISNSNGVSFQKKSSIKQPGEKRYYSTTVFHKRSESAPKYELPKIGYEGIRFFDSYQKNTIRPLLSSMRKFIR